MARATTTVAVGLLVWLAIAIVAGASGAVSRLRPPAPQLVLLALTLVLLLVGRAHSGLRAWITSRDWRALVAVHVTRLLAGGGFVWAATQGVLPNRFAIPAGYGDMAVALLAIGVLAMSPLRQRAPLVYGLWNLLGFVDILLVVTNAARVGLQAPEAMSALFRFPFSLLPTFLVPIVIATHIWLFSALARSRALAFGAAPA